MKTIVASVALFLVGAFAQSFTINTPSSVVECEPTLLSWTGGTAPYYLSVLPGNTPTGTPIETLTQTNSTSYTWQCNIASGTYIGFTLRDGTGQLAQSAAVSVQAGSSSSCLTSTSGASGTTAPSTSAAVASTAGVNPSTSSGKTTGTTAASSASPSTSSTTSSSGASANIAQFGAAGIVGAAVVALFL